jgi:superfamily II DNA or RNA helicase
MVTFNETKKACEKNDSKSNAIAKEYLLDTTKLKNSRSDIKLVKLTNNINTNWESQVFCLEGFNASANDIYRDIKSEVESRTGQRFPDKGGFNFTDKLTDDNGIMKKAWCTNDPNVILHTVKEIDAIGISTSLQLKKSCDMFNGIPNQFRQLKESKKRIISPVACSVENKKGCVDTTKVKGTVENNTTHIFIPMNSLTTDQIKKIDNAIEKDHKDSDRLVSYSEKGDYDTEKRKYTYFEVELISKQNIDGVDGYVAPIGIKQNIKSLLKKVNMDFEVEDKRKIPKGKPFKLNEKTESGIPLKLRDYQKEIVQTALKEEGGLISLATGGGKTLISSEIIANLGHDTVFYVPNVSLFYNAKNQIESYVNTDKVNIGQIGGEKVDLKDDPNKVDINIVSIPMAYRVFDGVKTDPEKKRAIKRAAEMSHVMIVDEVHHLPADKYKLISSNTPSKYRFGLSATPYREDGKDLEIIGGVGNKIGDIRAMDLVDRGYLTAPEIFIINNADISPTNNEEVLDNLRDPFCFSTLTNAMKKNVLRDQIPKNDNAAPHYFRKATTMCNHDRNDRIVDLAKKLDQRGKTNIIFVYYTAHGKLLVDKLRENHVNVELLTGTTESDIHRTTEELQIDDIKMKARNALFKRMKDGELNTIVATGQIMGEGVDIPDIDSIILADDARSKVNTVQKIGRSLRLKKGKEKSLIFDFQDTTPMIRGWGETRKEIYIDERFPHTDISYSNIDSVLNKTIGKAKPLSQSKIKENKMKIQEGNLQREYGKMKLGELKSLAKEVKEITNKPYSHLKKPELVSYLIENEMKK